MYRGFPLGQILIDDDTGHSHNPYIKSSFVNHCQNCNVTQKVCDLVK